MHELEQTIGYSKYINNIHRQISKQDDQLDLSSLKNEYNSVKIQELL